MRIPHHILDDEYPVVISDNSDVASTLGETDAESYCPDNLEYILKLNIYSTFNMNFHKFFQFEHLV